MKRFICLIMMLLLLVPTTFAAEEQMTFRMDSATGNVGDTVTVIGSVKNAPVCASFRVILTYDTSVLEPVSCSKLDCSGLFMSNINATYQNQKAVNVLSADANKVLSGDMQLFSVTFKILAETPGTNGTLINVAQQEFFDAVPERVYPIIESCRIYVGSDTPESSDDNNAAGGNEGSGSADDNTGSGSSNEGNTNSGSSNEGNTNSGSSNEGNTNSGSSNEGNTNSGSSNEGNTNSGSSNEGNTNNGSSNEGNTNSGSSNEGNTGNDSTSAGNTTTENKAEDTTQDESSKTEDKKPTGSWIVDAPSGDIYHVEENGDTTIYTPEYTETPEEGKVTEVILKDKETGEEAGSIMVEPDEEGSLKVIEQDLIKDRQEEKKPEFPVWGWILIGVVVVAVGAAAVWYFLIYRKKATDA